MAAPLHTPQGLTQSQHGFFLWALTRMVGQLQPAVMVDGQLWEQTYYLDGTRVALSDTQRNTRTDKKSKTRRSYGTITLEFITTDAAHQHMGAATHQLRALGKLADRWNITLRLRPLAHETSPLNDEQLTAWYKRLDYTEQDGLYLKRLPAEQRPKFQQPVAVAQEA